MDEKGLVLVYTGDGKGKTTAALGLAIRALGREKKVCIIQFIKSPAIETGEKIFFEKLGVEMYQMGLGFTTTLTPEDHRRALQEGWSFTKKKITTGSYDLVILDEINNALAIDRFSIDDVLPLADVIETIKKRPANMNIVLTGRNAKKEIIDLADLATHMEMEKHYYNKGIQAMKGIEY